MSAAAPSAAAHYRVAQIQTNERQSDSGFIDGFIASILSGTLPPVTGEDGLRSMQVVFAAMEFSKKRTTVQVSCR